MDEIIQLDTMSINLAQVNELYDHDDHILIVYSDGHDPYQQRLVGQDAEQMRTWLDEDWERRRVAYIQEAGRGDLGIPVIRPRYADFKEPPDVNTPPPF